MKTAQTTAPESIRNLKQVVEQTLNALKPMMQQPPQNISPTTRQTIANLDAISKELDQLSIQVGQLEQIKAKSQEVAQVQAADDEDYSARLGKIHKDKCADKPAFWRSNFDYGERAQRLEALASLANILDKNDCEREANEVDKLLKELSGE